MSIRGTTYRGRIWEGVGQIPTDRLHDEAKRKGATNGRCR